MIAAGKLYLPAVQHSVSEQSTQGLSSKPEGTWGSGHDQYHWLEELSRICRGTMILWIHGLYDSAKAASWAQVPDDLWSWILTGFKESPTPNLDINDVVE